MPSLKLISGSNSIAELKLGIPARRLNSRPVDGRTLRQAIRVGARNGFGVELGFLTNQTSENAHIDYGGAAFEPFAIREREGQTPEAFGALSGIAR